MCLVCLACLHASAGVRKADDARHRSRQHPRLLRRDDSASVRAVSAPFVALRPSSRQLRLRGGRSDALVSGQKSAPLSVEAWSRNVAAAATRNDKIMLTAHIRALLNATLRGLAGDDGDGDVGTVRSDQQTTTQSLLTCPRCWAFLLKPVTGPCGHTLCGGCARALGTDRCDSLNRSGCCGQVVAPACPVRGCIGLGRASGSSADEFRSHEWVAVGQDPVAADACLGQVAVEGLVHVKAVVAALLLHQEPTDARPRHAERRT